MAVILQTIKAVFRIVLRIYFQARTSVRNNQSLPRRAKALPENAVQPADALHAAVMHIEPYLPLQFLLHSDATYTFLLVLDFFVRQVCLKLCDAVVCMLQSAPRGHGHACCSECGSCESTAGQTNRLQHDSRKGDD